MVRIDSIDYDHARADFTCNGFISVQDGSLEAVWTYDVGGESVTRIEPVEPRRFDELCNAISASLAHQGVFWRHLVTDPTHLPDPQADHLITLVIEDGRGRNCLLFAIPAEEVEAEFTEWLHCLSMPTRRILMIAAE